MKNNLKRSLFISAAALGFFAVAGVSNGQTASAKTYAKVKSNQTLSMNPSDRNVNFTGSSALYTKASTLKGAKLVASASQLSSFANSNSSDHNVRAYRIAKTNRGSIYYKVVTFNGLYRGWIYGGKSNADFGGGLKGYNTLTPAALTTDQKNGTFKIANPGNANDGKTVTYKEPSWTQYKVGRQILDSSAYAGKTFTIDQAANRTREGDLWVHITATDSGNSAANGWILYSGLTAVSSPSSSSSSSSSTTPTTTAPTNPADKILRITFVDPNGNTIKSINYTNNSAVGGNTLGTANGSIWTLNASDVTSIQDQAAKALAGTGYTLANNTLTDDQKTSLAQAKFGSTVQLKTVAGNSSSTATKQASSVIVPSAVNQSTTYNWWDILHLFQINDSSVNAMTAFSDQYDNTKVDFPHVWNQDQWLPTPSDQKYSAQDLANMKPDDQAYKNIIASFSGFTFNLDANSLNLAFRQAVAGKYIAPSNFSISGNQGATFTNGDALSAVYANNALLTLKSPMYPQFVQKNGKWTIEWDQVSYTAQSAGNGSYGNPVQVMYSYNLAVK
ncbi:MAG: surface layer protein SlpB [Lentilactobacillus hilgardii]|uniref:surface layer protein SlpB n=1 Tax=Lentilactobacillus hilgardii TaxID=1588 RepID=UPI001CC1C4DC|nr:surface layer protein SlpB [Lentilactobacillus hilgardii]MBZ2199939.1 surface layer protein SlpB [Lentilactobacillus hilgardii]MBZ2203059.1 surface layer protein SlpB [Lentilactobacillus hilgardii]